MQKMLLIVGIFLFGVVTPTSAALVTATYKTEFDGGHRAEGTIVYDDTFPIVSGDGLAPTMGIDYLDVTFFNPNNIPLYSVVDVMGGVSSYFFLQVEFDTTIPNFVLFELHDIGHDSETVGEYWMSGFVGGSATIRAASIGNRVDITSDWSFMVNIVPEPSTLVLAALGLMGIGYCQRIPSMRPDGYENGDSCQ